jgi:hypothetical protein
VIPAVEYDELPDDTARVKVSLMEETSAKAAGGSADKSCTKSPQIALAEFQRIRDEIDSRSVMQQALLGAGVLSWRPVRR